jgi:hypothetical protein
MSDLAQQLDILFSGCLLACENKFTGPCYGNYQGSEVVGRVLDIPMARVKGNIKNSFHLGISVDHKGSSSRCQSELRRNHGIHGRLRSTLSAGDVYTPL